MNFPDDIRYTREHEWAREQGGVVTVGITGYATEQLGDVVFVELPEVGRTLEAGKTFGVVEAVKTVSDLYAPLAGEVIEPSVSVPTATAQRFAETAAADPALEPEVLRSVA